MSILLREEFIVSANVIYLGIIVFAKNYTYEALKLDKLTTFHNMCLILWSFYILYGTLHTAISNKYLFWGNSCEQTSLRHYIISFYISKIYEMLDTMIMIAKRNFHQVSFLHVYHHSTISMIWFIIAKYYSCVDAYIPICLNSTIHVIMYANYCFNTTKNKSIKKVVTRLQLLQFVLMSIHSLRFSFDSTTLGHLCRIQGIYMITMIYLFGRFYQKTYHSIKKDKLHSL